MVIHGRGEGGKGKNYHGHLNRQLCCNVALSFICSSSVLSAVTV